MAKKTVIAKSKSTKLPAGKTPVSQPKPKGMKKGISK